MMKTLLLCVLSYCLLITQMAHANEPLQTVSQTELASLSQQADTVIIDVRTRREYANGHIPGAINLPHRDIISGKLTFDPFKGKNLVLYCHSGVRVGIVNRYLQQNPSHPRENILHLKGDFRAWRARGKPITKP